ncbi:MAG: hypothetical protein SFV15_10860 [Polyangiaceae bacterium]|nr:hypothetical protein [Polyangiaceae bacterium]
MILTSTHELDSKERRAGSVVRNPVTIGGSPAVQLEVLAGGGIDDA